MSSVSAIKMTARQFLQLGEDPPGVRLELVDGEIAVSPSPAPDHSYVEKMLTIILGRHILAQGLGQLFGDVDTVFGSHEVRRPDLIFFRNERLHLVGDQAMEGPPDLCVEVISPGSVRMDRENKFHLYQSEGVAYYWIINPLERTFEAYQLRDGRYTLIARGENDQTLYVEPFSDLAIPLDQLWRPRV